MACTHVHSVSGVKGWYGMQTIKPVNNDTIKWEMKWNENGLLYIYIVSTVNYNQRSVVNYCHSQSHLIPVPTNMCAR